MCGRIYIPDVTAIEREFHLGRVNRPELFEPRYNVAPEQGKSTLFVQTRRT